MTCDPETGPVKLRSTKLNIKFSLSALIWILLVFYFTLPSKSQDYYIARQSLVACKSRFDWEAITKRQATGDKFGAQQLSNQLIAIRKCTILSEGVPLFAAIKSYEGNICFRPANQVACYWANAREMK